MRNLRSGSANWNANGGGTLDLPDGVYGINRTLRLPSTVSLSMSPHATIRALPGFEGEAVVLKAVHDKEKEVHQRSGWIRVGGIDGGKLPETGLKIEGCSRLEISELDVHNAVHKGIHSNGWYEVNMHNIRCNVDLDVRCGEGSIGLHYENADSIAHTAMIVGYEVGVGSDGGSNDFDGIHVWNYDPAHGPMDYCSYCNGTGDTYVQCYADSPCIAGFYVRCGGTGTVQTTIKNPTAAAMAAHQPITMMPMHVWTAFTQQFLLGQNVFSTIWPPDRSRPQNAHRRSA